MEAHLVSLLSESLPVPRRIVPCPGPIHHSDDPLMANLRADRRGLVQAKRFKEAVRGGAPLGAKHPGVFIGRRSGDMTNDIPRRSSSWQRLIEHERRGESNAAIPRCWRQTVEESRTRTLPDSDRLAKG